MVRTRKSVHRRSNRGQRKSNWATCNSNSDRMCFNGGECKLYNNIKPLCVCPNGFTGEFCQERSHSLAHAKQGHSPLAQYSLIMFGFIVLLSLFVKKRTSNRWELSIPSRIQP